MAKAENDIHSAARDYAKAGWSVVPMVPHGKQPLIGWLEFQNRRATEREIDAWFKRWPSANVAVVTGAISGILVLDIDARHGGEASLRLLDDEVGPIPSTLEALTGSGGRHLYFVHSGETIGNRVGLRPGIDLRGDGGVVVVPPSVHPSGRSYRWARGHAPPAATPAPLPTRLLAELTAKGESRGHSLRYWRDLVAAGVGEGERNNTIASLAGHLLWHATDPDIVAELLYCWNRVRCRPPLSDEELFRTVHSIVKMHRHESNTPPVPGAKTH